MICVCYQRQLELLSRFQGLPSNVGSSLVLPTGLLPAIGALNSALMSASAALAAAPSGGLNPAASTKAAAATELSASPQLQAAAQLSALASAASAMNAGLGLNMTSPSAGGMCGALGTMLPDFINTLAQLPLYLLAKLLQLAQVGELVQKLKQLLDVDLEAPQWGKDLGDAVANKLAEAMKSAEDALKNALAGFEDLANAAAKAASAAAAQAAALASATGQAIADAIANAASSTMAAVQAGLGIDLLVPGALDVLGKKLAVMKGNLSGMPAVLDPLAVALLLSAMQVLSAIDMLRRTLGIDVLAPGAGGSLQSLLNALTSNLAGAGAACAALNGAASAAAALGGGADGSMSLGGGVASGGASLGASPGASLGTSLGASAGGGPGGSAAAGLAALANSPLMSPALAQMMAGMPAMPIPWMLLSSLCVQVQSTLGIQLIAHGPCE